MNSKILGKCLNAKFITTVIVVAAAAAMFAGSMHPIEASDNSTLDLTSKVYVYDVISGTKDTTAAVSKDAAYGAYFSTTQPTSITRDGTTYYLQNWTNEDGSLPAFTYKTVDAENATIGFNMPANDVTVYANYTTDAPTVVQKDYLPDGSVGTNDPKDAGTSYTLPTSYYDGTATYTAMTSVVYSDLFNDFTAGVVNNGESGYGSMFIAGSGATVSTSYTSNTDGNISAHTIYEGASVSGKAPKEGALVAYWVKAYNNNQIFDQYSMYYLDGNGAQVSCTDKSSADYIGVTKYKTLLVSGDTATAYYVLVFEMPAHDVYFDFTYKDDETSNKIVTKSSETTPENTTLSSTINSYGNLIIYNGTELKGQVYSNEIQDNRTRILAAQKTLGDGKIFFVKSSDGENVSTDGTGSLYIAYDNDGDGTISSTELKSYSQKIQ